MGTSQGISQFSWFHLQAPHQAVTVKIGERAPPGCGKGRWMLIIVYGNKQNISSFSHVAELHKGFLDVLRQSTSSMCKGKKIIL